MFDFLKYRYICGCLSLAMIVTAGVTYWMRGGFRYSVDFTGGTEILVKMKKPAGMLELRSALEKGGWNSVLLREFADREVLIRVPEFYENLEETAAKIRGVLHDSGYDVEDTLRTDSVGSEIGNMLRTKSIMSVLLALALMLAYIAWRFWSLGFALGAVIAIFHDAIAILMCFLLFNQEISINVIGAILATLGYSINDTIVIFSRMRDNMVKMRSKTAYEVANISLNQTLRRTLLTSLSTALVVGALCIFGGEVLRSLSFALLLGIVFGTYSSIYIASPVMLLFNK